MGYRINELILSPIIVALSLALITHSSKRINPVIRHELLHLVVVHPQKIYRYLWKSIVIL